MWAIGLFTAFLTAFYMFRLLFLTFFGEFRGTEEQKHHLHESPVSMTLPLIILAVLAAVGGFMGAPMFMGGRHYLADYLAPIFTYSQQINPGAFAGELDHSTELMLIGAVRSGRRAGYHLGLSCCTWFAPQRPVAEDEAQRSAPESLVYHKYYIDELYNALFVRPIMGLSRGLYRFVEQGIIDPIVNGLGRLTLGGGQLMRFVQTGTIGVYLILMVIGIVLILALNFGKF